MKPFPIRALALALAAAAIPLAAPMTAGPAAAQQKLEPSERDDYIRKHGGTFEEWGRKVDEFSDKTTETGNAAAQKTKRELNEAWRATKATWEELKSASKDKWQDAKAAFEKNWQKLQDAWNEAQS